MEQQQNQQRQQGFSCSGDCLRCSVAQRQYCSSQFTFNTMRIVQNMQATLNAMQGTIEDLKAKIEAIQNNEAMVFDPTHEKITVSADEEGIVIQPDTAQ